MYGCPVHHELVLELKERAKYRAVWSNEFYREQADGDPVVSLALELMGCQPGETLIDWGCGMGTPAQQFQDFGLVVTAFDIAENCLSQNVFVPLVVGCLWSPPEGLKADYGFCTDVLEHVPPEMMDQTLDVLHERTDKVAYIQVDTAPDICGERMDPPQTLHLSVHPSEWWTEQLKKRWPVVLQHRGRFSRVGFSCYKDASFSKLK